MKIDKPRPLIPRKINPKGAEVHQAAVAAPGEWVPVVCQNGDEAAEIFSSLTRDFTHVEVERRGNTLYVREPPSSVFGAVRASCWQASVRDVD